MEGTNLTVNTLDTAIKAAGRIKTCVELGVSPTDEDLNRLAAVLEDLGFVPVPGPVITVL